MKIKILKENFPNEMPSGPSLGQPGPSNASMPETKRKMMVLMDRIGKALDEIVTYDNVYDDISASFINLKPAPIIKNFNYLRDENNEKVYRTLEETALERAKTIALRHNATSIARTFKKTISQAITVSKLLEDVNQYLQIIESIGVDRSLALYVKDVIYKDRSVRFKNAGAYLRKLYNYGDYLAATGLAIESLTKILPKLSNPGVGLAIKSIAESFTINFKSLWSVITEQLMDSGDLMPSRREFMHAIEPEILKYLMKIKKPTSLYDMLHTDGFMKEMVQKFPIANLKADISGGTAKILLRKALYALGKKGFLIMTDGSKYYSARDTDQFILNPEMVQQAGEEYFPKPEGIMENKKVKIKILKEATGEQKRQQKRDAYSSRERQRKKLKARIKRSQNKGEAPFKSDRPDFDPIKDLGRAMKKRYKDLEVRANGEEIED